MTRKNPAPCCGTPAQEGNPDNEIPVQIQSELDAIGGLDALARHIPSTAELGERSRIYQAFSDPLRLTILYLVRDQPLCVCVINRFMHLAGPKLSYHLNILKESGLIEGKYQGNWILYSITERGRRVLHCTEHAGR